VSRLEQVFGVGYVHNETVVFVDGQPLFLTHKPRVTWDPTITYHLHGHVHDNYARKGNAINVGVDVRGFAPATLEELLATPHT
jgi:calcineurin-like phosphoesterase family protein